MMKKINGKNPRKKIFQPMRNTPIFFILFFYSNLVCALTDPTRPFDYQETRIDRRHLNPTVKNFQGVIQNNGNYLAIVNEKILAVGDRIGEDQVSRIDATTVCFIKGSEHECLKRPTDVKRHLG